MSHSNRFVDAKFFSCFDKMTCISLQLNESKIFGAKSKERNLCISEYTYCSYSNGNQANDLQNHIHHRMSIMYGSREKAICESFLHVSAAVVTARNLLFGTLLCSLQSLNATTHDKTRGHNFQGWTANKQIRVFETFKGTF